MVSMIEGLERIVYPWLCWLPLLVCQLRWGLDGGLEGLDCAFLGKVRLRWGLDGGPGEDSGPRGCLWWGV
jgi:hypothetical protein